MNFQKWGKTAPEMKKTRMELKVDYTLQKKGQWTEDKAIKMIQNDTKEKRSGKMNKTSLNSE